MRVTTVLKGTLTALSGISILLAGCGPSASEKKTEAAIERAGNRPSPGYIRLINLTNAKITVVSKGRPVVAPTKPDEASLMVPIGVGSQKIDLGGLGKGLAYNAQMESNLGITLVLYPDQHIAAISGERRSSVDSSNVQLHFLDVQGKPLTTHPALELSGPSGVVPVPANAEEVNLAAGTYKVSGPGIDESTEIKDKVPYSFYFIERPNKKVTAWFLQNGPNPKPGINGASAA